MERNKKYDYFKIDASKVGGYIVKKSRLIDKSITLGVVVCNSTDKYLKLTSTTKMFIRIIRNV